MQIRIVAQSLGQLVRLGKDLALPATYTAVVDDKRLPCLVLIEVVVETGGVPTCRAVRCEQRPGGEPVSGEMLRRVPLAKLIRQSAEVASWRPFIDPKTGEVVGGAVTSVAEGASVAEALGGRRRRRQLTDALMEQVAKVYKAAKAAPTDAVAEAFQVARPTAGAWVMQARKRGFLPKIERKSQRGKKR